ncbi:hypothetical protein DUNSADRAFT_7572 [Dunaliella salina]|uniref:Uncharacterized protein n=1 Tax=Dunaliella salina TaxID=3046 RepID=A0ABZ3L1P2_DUNSA|nr:hypothetical protein DUNSADRAFT_7572 [Dunaliella salina]|eukprot:KAF5835340.1 hypothetical protein DUNSADRAFT_7572 [Dunaliella salina]
MPQHDGARTGWLSEFIVLPQVLKACQSEGFPLSQSQLQALFTDVQPPPDGKFIGVFLEMLEALQGFSPPPFAPPLSWLHALDEALLARSNATSWGDCSSDYENGLQRIRDLTLPVNPQELLLVLRHLVTAQISSPPEGVDGRMFLFPLAAEACIKDSSNPSEFAAAMEEIEAFHAAVQGRHHSQDSSSQTSQAGSRGTAYVRSALSHGGGSGGGQGTSTHLHWQLQVPLLRRYGTFFEYQDMLALTRASLSSIEDRCSISVNMVDSKIAEVVAWISRTTQYHGIQPYQLHPPVVEGAVGCMRDAAVLLSGGFVEGAVRYPQVGPSCDEDPSLDLLTRIGLRLSRSLNAQSPEQRVVTLQQLGVLT